MLETQIYLLAVAAYGPSRTDWVYSSEVPVIVYLIDRPNSDPTQQEGTQGINMVYGGDFETDADWTKDGGAAIWPGAIQQPTAWTNPSPTWSQESGAAIAAITQVTDGLDTTYYKGTGTSDETGIISAPTVLIHSFGAGTNKVCRTYARIATWGNIGWGTVEAYYTLDRTAGTPVYVLFGVTGSHQVYVDFLGPELVAVDYAKIGIRLRAVGHIPNPGPGTRSEECRVAKVYVEEKTAAGFAASITGNVGVIYGDGGTPGNYGVLHRPFPGKIPTGTQTAFNLNTLNHCRIQLRKHVTTDTLDGNPVEIRVHDMDSGSVWLIGTIPSSAITDSWKDHAMKFSTSSAVVGTDLHIEVRTKNAKAIECDKLLVARGDTLFRWTTSPENQAAGYFGDFKNGDASGFEKGTWAAGDRKTSLVA
jgi:hypothetical protein